jgi:hypothetical protein
MRQKGIFKEGVVLYEWVGPVGGEYIKMPRGYDDDAIDANIEQKEKEKTEAAKLARERSELHLG